MEFEVVCCSFPGCGCRGLAERFYVPSRDAVREANNGIMVKAVYLSRFAVCTRHAAVIRKDGVGCYPLVVARRAVEDDEARAELLASQEEQRQEARRRQRQLAAFQPKGIKPTGQVGNGLSRFRRPSAAPLAAMVH